MTEKEAALEKVKRAAANVWKIAYEIGYQDGMKAARIVKTFTKQVSNTTKPSSDITKHMEEG